MSDTISFNVRNDTDIVFGKGYIQIAYIEDGEAYEAAFWNEDEFKESTEAVFAALNAVKIACTMGAIELDDEEIIRDKKLENYTVD